jgi:hypothetical protein
MRTIARRFNQSETTYVLAPSRACSRASRWTGSGTRSWLSCDCVVHAEDGTIAISDLAKRILLSPSHVYRLVIDLERRSERLAAPTYPRSSTCFSTRLTSGR